MKFWMLILFFPLPQTIFGQHEVLIKKLPTENVFNINNGDLIEFELLNYDPKNAGVKYPQYNKYDLIFKNTSSGTIYTIGFNHTFFSFTYWNFPGTTGSYKVEFNVDLSFPDVDADGKLFILSKKLHLERNQFNKVAKGILVRKSQNVFLDENGCDWVLQDDCSNCEHNPAMNAKFLHSNPGGGEFETIREILPNERTLQRELCVKCLGYIDYKVITADTLRGVNVISMPYGSTYNFGHTSDVERHLKLDYFPHKDWGNTYVKYPVSYMSDCLTSGLSTLLLFDVSGSMAQNNKWDNAKRSALTALNSIRSQAQSANQRPSLSIRAFDGDCNTDPTQEVIGFTADLTAVEDAIRNKVPPPGGATPLPQAIAIARQKLDAYAGANNIKNAKLIVLTDGASTCGSLRPQGVYGYGQQGFQASQKLSAAGTPNVSVRYYTIGFDIPPGSEAERDLQYLAQTNGGKYLNAQNEFELTGAFYKFNRVYTPKTAPSISPVAEKDLALFTKGLDNIEEEAYDKALENFKTYSTVNAGDANGIYNTALMSEANDRYKAAIKNYELYLQLAPGAPDKKFVEETLQHLRETAKRYATYTKQVVKSDMQYLDLYFKKIQNGESIALAVEFIGFLREKYSFYRDLAAIVEVEDRLFKTNASEVFKGLKQCAETIDRNPRAWDRDATPVLSRTYLNMERLYNSF